MYLDVTHSEYDGGKSVEISVSKAFDLCLGDTTVITTVWGAPSISTANCFFLDSLHLWTHPIIIQINNPKISKRKKTYAV